MKKVIYLLILLLMPASIYAESYTSLWKKVAEAQSKDLPKTQIECLRKIINKAENEKQYGHLLKAQLQQAAVQTQISPDSLTIETERLVQKAEDAKDEVVRAVYASVLGKIYQQQEGKDAQDKSKTWFAKSMANPKLLAGHKSEEYSPAIVAGIDSKIFYDDLLHVIGFEAEDYNTLYHYYSQNGNRAAACITALYRLRKNSDENVMEVRKSKYLQAVDSLINVYGDLREAGELAIEHYNFISQCEDSKVEDRINYINYALSRWGAWPRMNILRNAQSELQRPAFNINIGDYMLLPNTERKVRINSIRNINELNVNLYRLNIKGDTDLNPDKKEDYAKLQKLIFPGIVQSVTRNYIGQPAWKENSDSITLKGLPIGVYLMEATTDNKNIAPQRALLRVSNLYVMHEGQPDKRIRFVVVNATTGKPVPSAHIVLTNKWGNRDEKTEKINLTSDKNGEADYRYDDRAPRQIYVYTNEDQACGNFDINGYYSHWDKDAVRQVLKIYTDRSIYRPGQQVCVSAIAYETNSETLRSKALGSQKITFSLRNENGQEIATKDVMTDDYGTASTTFSLPQNGLTGRFGIYAKGERLFGGTSFNVEQYKRPTFQVRFDTFDKKYSPGDTVQVRGIVESYAGVPVQGAKVEYTVERRRSIWWRWGIDDSSPILLIDSTVTADDGTFMAKMPMQFPDDIEPGMPLYYNVVVNAKVTDGAGETHEGSYSLPLSNKSSILLCDLPEKSLRDSLKAFTFTRKNVAGQNIAGTIRYQIDNNAWKTAEANQKIAIGQKLASGKHRIVGICENDTVKHDFIIFSYNDKKPAVETHDWFYISSDRFSDDGKPVYMQLGSSDEDVNIYYSVFTNDKILDQGRKVLNNSVMTEKLTYKETYGDGITVNIAWVKHGHLYTHNFSLQRPLPKKELTLSWKTFRDKLVPGQKEEWTLQILGPDGKPSKSQLLATMYDKSLDDIIKHSWDFTVNFNLALPYVRWYGGSNSALGLYGFQSYKSLAEHPLAFSHFDKAMFEFASPFIRAYTRAQTMMALNSANVRVRGNKPLAKEAMAQEDMIVADAPAAVGMGKASEQKSDAGANKQDDKNSQDASVQLRENFNETAFFYPALVADAQGNVKIKFTLPESVTTWHFMGLAHNEQIDYGMISADAVAKKTVMVQPNLPRFIRMGDKAGISSRIINTSDKSVSGTARLQLINPETEAVICEWSKPYTIEAGKTGNVDFSVDGDKLATLGKGAELYIARITAEGNGYSDGEQHYLPLLSNREYITTTVPFTQNGPGVKTIDLSKLFPTNSPQNKLTVEYTNNPTWLMIQALPSVANPHEKDAISLAAAIYANSIGYDIVKSSPKIKQTIKLWQQEQGKETSLMSNLQKNEDLKTMILSETPWLAAAEKETDQKHQLVNFLDESTIGYRLDNFTQKLQSLQNTDGSFSWWPGMRGSAYVTIAVTKILTRLNALTGTVKATSDILDNAFRYLDRRIAEEVIELKKQEKKGQKNLMPSELACDYLYSNALANRKKTKNMTYLVGLLEKMPTKLTIYGKAGAAVILAQYGKQQRAEEYLQSVSEYTVYTEEMGRYFDTPRAQYSWSDHKIPTQVAAIEAMKLIKPTNSKTIEEMLRWLLQEKRTTGWNTPINAVDAVFAFLTDEHNKVDMSRLSSGEQSTLKIDGQSLTLPQATAGMGYVKTSTFAGNGSTFTAEKSSDGTSWGALYAQFWQENTEVKTASSGLTVRREIVSADNDKDATRLKVGDKVTVRITITADRDYDFVQIQDKRAACLEPVGQISGYHWGYYCSPQDNVTTYYFDRMGKGTHVVETQYYVDREGDYTTGICTAQCAYSPDFSAREAAKKLHVAK
jgi:hypothetical protein